MRRTSGCSSFSPRQIATEVAALSDRFHLEEYGLLSHTEEAQRFGVRYLGLPAGYEFVTLLEAIVAVSRGRGDVTEATRRVLTALPGDVHLQVFVTPT